MRHGGSLQYFWDTNGTSYIDGIGPASRACLRLLDRPLNPTPPWLPPPTPLQARIEQAEAGGCPEGLVAEAKRQLHRLLLAEVRAELEAGECSIDLECLV